MKPPAWKVFELSCAGHLHAAGWGVVMHSQPGDQGVDLLATKQSVRVAIQCKFYAAPVGNGAVQEAHAGKAFYRAHHAAVVSRSGYTPGAKALAGSTGVSLLAPHDLSHADKLFGVGPVVIPTALRPCRCGRQLRLPKNSGGYVTCPVCGYRRFWTT